MKCKLCNHEFPDYYTSCHAPDGTCYECWLSYWELEAYPRAILARPYTREEIVMVMRAAGHTTHQVAAIMQIGTSKLYEILRGIKRHPEKMEEWLGMVKEKRRRYVRNRNRDTISKC